MRGQATATGRAEDDPELLAQVALCAAPSSVGVRSRRRSSLGSTSSASTATHYARRSPNSPCGSATVTATASTRVRSEAGVVAYLGFTSALLAIGIDTALPAFDEIREEFSLADGSGEVSLVVTAYFLGMAAGQLPMGPLSDRFGRRPVLLASFALYLIGALGATLAPSFGILLGARFLWGLGAAGPAVIGNAIARDLYSGDQMAGSCRSRWRSSSSARRSPLCSARCSCSPASGRPCFSSASRSHWSVPYGRSGLARRFPATGADRSTRWQSVGQSARR